MEPTTLNLLPQEEVSLGEKALKWALTSGRVIVVVTEFIVISAFLYRFVLDRSYTNLKTSIDDNTIILEESRDTERLIRLVQTQLTEADRILHQHNFQHLLINRLANDRPPEITFGSVEVKDKTVKISASSNQTSATLIFFQNLKDDPALTDVRIDEIGVTAGKVKISLTAQVRWENITDEKV